MRHLANLGALGPRACATVYVPHTRNIGIICIYTTTVPLLVKKRESRAKISTPTAH